MTKKYEMIKNDFNMYRIKALIDIPRYGVMEGDIGGVIQGERNLSQKGDCWIERRCLVHQDARVEGNALVRGQSSIRGNALICGNSTVDSCNVNGDAIVDGNAVVTGCNIHGSSFICDNTRIQNTVFVDCVLKGQTQISLPGDWVFTIRDLRGEFTEKDVFVQGPALSSNRYSLGYRQKDGSVKITTGCFEGALDEYLAAIEDTHKDNPEYLAQYRQFHQNFVKHFSQ